MKRTIALTTVLGLLAFSSANAAEFNQENLYVGGGLSSNGLDVSGGSPDRAIGYQLFAGYDFDVEFVDDLKTIAEVGFMSSGDFKYDVTIFNTTTTVNAGSVSGLWATYVADYAVNDKVNILGRLGLDFGDDDGLMFGGGAGYMVNDQVSVRAEYVLRQNVDSLQVNVTYSF